VSSTTSRSITKAMYVPLGPDAGAKSSREDAVSETKNEGRIRAVCDRSVAYLREG
jgi:hypothetical protein